MMFDEKEEFVSEFKKQRNNAESLMVTNIDIENKTITIGEGEGTPSSDVPWADGVTMGPIHELDPEALFNGEIKVIK